MRKSFPITTLFLGILFLLAAVPATAQEDPILTSIFNEINEKYCKRAEQALKKDMNRFQKMKAELEETDKIKDNNGKKKGLENYNRAHKEHYKKVLQEEGLNLPQLLAGLQQKYPGYTFSIVEDYSILIEKNSSDIGGGSTACHQADEEQQQLLYDPKTSGPNAGNGVPYPPAAMSFQDLVFTQTKAVNCKMGSGGNVEFDPKMVTAWSTGAVAADCISKGELANQTLIPVMGVRSAILTLGGSVECSGYSLGIFGVSVSSATASITARIAETGSYFTNIKLSINRMAVAPMLWYASFNEFLSNNYTLDLTPWRGRSVAINAYSSTSANAYVCCGTTATAKTTITAAFLNLSR